MLKRISWDEFGSGEILRLMKLEKTMLMELLDRMRTDLGHARNKIFHVWITPRSCGSHQEFKEKTMTNVFRQFLMSTYNVRALLEAEAMCLTDILVIFGSGEID